MSKGKREKMLGSLLLPVSFFWFLVFGFLSD